MDIFTLQVIIARSGEINIKRIEPLRKGRHMNNDSETQWTKIGLIEDRIKETQDPKFIHLFINELAKKKLLN